MNSVESKRAWVPEERFGDYLFGSPVDPVQMNLRELKEESDDFWSAFEEVESDDIRIYTENGLITCVGAYEYFYYGGKNLVGLPFEEALVILKVPYDHSEIHEVLEEQQIVYKFEKLSLVVWVKDGRVVSLQCSEKVDD